MLPGAGKMKDQLSEIDESELKRTEAIIRSMTPQERAKPELLTGSRRSRIANGSGTTVAQVNSLIKRFSDAQKMMKSGHIPGIGNIPGLPSKNQKSARTPKGAKRSGNPAKRASQT